MIRAKRKANRNASAKKRIKVFALIMTVKIIIAHKNVGQSRDRVQNPFFSLNRIRGKSLLNHRRNGFE